MGPRSAEEALADVLLRVGVAAAVLAGCLAVLPVWGTALAVAYAYRLASGRIRWGWEWLPRLDLAALAGLGLLAAWRLGLEPA
ncbi:MAG TPA: hypothetical protein VH257_24180, partial [Chloroflexota bacterium]|nr:hypothetical protein [Chloroflexota bacterium]